MSVATLSQTIPGPWQAMHQRELVVAQQRSRKIRKAVTVAAFNGWVTAFFALTSAPFAPFSIAGALVTIGLAVVAYNEFRGRKQLLKFEPDGTSLLGWNQVGFLALIVVYCLWMIYSGLRAGSPFAAELAAHPELGQVLGSLDQFDQLYQLIVVAVYGTTVLLSCIFQGCNAWYYFSRRKYVEAYLRETPVWVLDVQRAMATA